MGKFRDLTGQTINSWTVIRREPTVGRCTMWLCRCKCGNESTLQGGGLIFGSTKNCGRGMCHFNAIHGMTKSRLFSIWGSMRDRCNLRNHVAYKNYGGRGITIEWQSFDDFRKDMQSSYDLHVSKFGEKQTTIDRIDVNGNYCKENCRWATYKEQHANKRKRA